MNKKDHNAIRDFLGVSRDREKFLDVEMKTQVEFNAEVCKRIMDLEQQAHETRCCMMVFIEKAEPGWLDEQWKKFEEENEKA